MSEQVRTPLPVDEATQAADAAARAAGVVVREVGSNAELQQVLDLFTRIWGRGDNPPLSLELMRAFAKAGNYVTGAFAADDRLVGACAGFFHSPLEDTLHSHIAGVDPTMPARGVGFALKLHQRAWTLLRGVSRVAWTYDPLVTRNASFNLTKLGARPVEYLPDFYGPMLDTINGAGESDRLLVRWDLLAPDVAAAAAGASTPASYAAELAGGATVVVDTTDAGLPSLLPIDRPLAGRRFLVSTPPDIAALRGTDVEAGRAWRLAVREALATLLGAGGRVTGFDRAGWYVVEVDR